MTLRWCFNNLGSVKVKGFKNRLRLEKTQSYCNISILNRKNMRTC